MNIAVWLSRNGAGSPDAPALAVGNCITDTYGDLASFTARRASALRAAYGLKPGDRVAIVAKNSRRYVKCLYAIWHAGLCAVPVNAKLHGEEIRYILENSGAKLAFVSDDMAGAVGGHAPSGLKAMIVIGGPEYSRLTEADPMKVADVRPDAPAWLFYTSGTTGRPKGAALTHRNLAAMSYAYALEVDPILPGDPILHAAPMSHGSGLYIMAHVMRAGINVIPESGGFDPAEIFRSIGDWPRLSMFAAPTMIKRLVNAPGDCASRNIRTIIWGGAPMYVADTITALDRFGPCFAQIYGQGESPMTITTLPKAEIGDRSHPRWRERLASAGRAYACMEVRIVDEDDRDVPVGESGEIICRGDPVMPGYWENPQANARAMRGGWLHTGDIGALDAEGYLTLKDRSKDVIISGGANIYPREVEEVLLLHPSVREVSVIGRRDEEWGEVLVAYVVGQAPTGELDALCLSKIARFKRPKDYVFIEALPKNSYGKILKTELRALDAAKTDGG
ncbi:MAG: AMP-binding protein [Methylocystis sp.]|nr:AMP-binding protein [Methylocystis sp.]MCA3587181.1 AMP-binding protein [Methylocystis sp.]MCA3590541.1 AMP-binding protein [Methylocystis sp.]